MIDVVVFHFCLAVDDDALCLFVVDQNGDVVVAFYVSSFSAGGDRAYDDLTVHVSVADRNGVDGSVSVIATNPRSAVRFKQRLSLFSGEWWGATSV